MCVCDQHSAVHLQNAAITICHQILESIAYGPTVHSAFTIQSVKGEAWLGGGAMFSTACVFHTEFPWPSKALQPWTMFLCPHSIGTGMEWYAWNVSTLQNIFGSSLSLFLEKPLLCSICFSDLYIFVYF